MPESKPIEDVPGNYRYWVCCNSPGGYLALGLFYALAPPVPQEDCPSYWRIYAETHGRNCRQWTIDASLALTMGISLAPGGGPVEVELKLKAKAKVRTIQTRWCILLQCRGLQDVLYGNNTTSVYSSCTRKQARQMAAHLRENSYLPGAKYQVLRIRFIGNAFRS